MVASAGKIVGICIGSFLAFTILFVIYLHITLGAFKETFDGWYRSIARLRHRQRKRGDNELGGEQLPNAQMSSITHLPTHMPPERPTNASFDSILTGTTLVCPSPTVTPPRVHDPREVVRRVNIEDPRMYAATLTSIYFI
ncbi:hypothetical protein PILCRDRAFT_826052 [Piloderma croceum F 1598]|uniref:Uncharacterized protein n=1 Tax=Piloderma croceum (strain F 1598) TaxID=765440 RepID=A0A0C3BHJ5_PILCF|nr:hypothetical protein PILCRDRAFT_826052 [Piloderma croceum F 1598]